MMNKKFMIGGCAAVAIAGNVFADEDISYFNPYASLKGGYAYLSKRNDIKYKGGFAGAVELGVSYDAWRLGLELGYKSNKIKDFKKSDALGTSAHAPVAAAGKPLEGYAVAKGFSVNGMETVVWGHNGGGAENWQFLAFKLSKINTLSGMLNVCYDYAMTEAWSIYAGIGLGAAKVSYTFEASTGNTGENSNNNVNFDAGANDGLAVATVAALKDRVGKNLVKTEYSKTVFAWQLMAGVGYEFNENWKLTLGYKLFNTAKVKQTFAGKEYKIKTPFNHTAEVGLTYTF
jgi:opacity protein-like surface antigen